MCEMVSCNVLNDVSKCYYVAEMDENKYQYQYQLIYGPYLYRETLNISVPMVWKQHKLQLQT
jgi:hypothetical protein